MSDIAECLKNIIGLTPSECECIDFPDNWESINASVTGEYIDDIELGIPLNIPTSPTKCGPGSLVDILQKARESAIKDFVMHYSLALKKNQVRSFDTYYDEFGEWKNNTVMSYMSNDWAGMMINPGSIYKGASICITAGSLSIEGGEDKVFNVHVIKMDDPTKVLHTITVEGGGVKSPFIGDDIVLPLSDGKGNKCHYALIYDRQGCKPYDIKFDCGCSGKRPVWQSMDYFTVNGVETPRLEDLPYTQVTSQHSNGLIVCFTMKCDGLSWLCDTDKDFWCNTDFGRVATKVIQILANIKLIAALCRPGQVNFTTIQDGEKLQNRLEWLQSKFDVLIPFLADRNPSDASHCFICDPHLGFKIQEDLV